MEIKLIVTDMDGTLMTSEHVMDKTTKEALMEAQKRGIKLVLASGRTYDHMYPTALELEMDKYGGYIICDNGAGYSKVIDNKRKEICSFTKQEGKELYEFITPYDTDFMIITDKAIYRRISSLFSGLFGKKVTVAQQKYIDEHPWFFRPDEEVVDYTNEHYKVSIDIKSADEIPDKLTKVGTCTYDPKILAKIQKDLLEKFGDKYNAVFCSESWLEVNPSLATKGQTLKMVGEELGISLDQAMVFGDSENDVSMFNECKYAVAMGNAMDLLKNVAFESTDSNDNCGIANYLKRNVLK